MFVELIDVIIEMTTPDRVLLGYVIVLIGAAIVRIVQRIEP